MCVCVCVQVEDLIDPMHPNNKDTLLVTNIPANVICWNAIGRIFSAFLFFFD